jgi:hypothetical protein
MDRVLMTLTPEQIARLRQLHWLATKHWSASIGMDALVLRADGSRMDTLTLELSAERQRREQAERQLERAKLDLTNALNPDAVLG